MKPGRLQAVGSFIPDFDALRRRPGRFQPARHEIDVPPKHFTGRLTRQNIFGEWWCSARDGFFTVRWGRFFAYLHQFDETSQASLIAQCKSAHYQRDYPHVLPVEDEGN